MTLVKLYRKIRYRKGFGVHSPFVYNLITNVIEGKTSHYTFEKIEQFRRQLISSGGEQGRITAQETQSVAFGALLFRIVNFFKCKNAIIIGGSTGVISLYIAMATPAGCDCYLLDERNNLAESVNEFAIIHHLSKLHYLEGSLWNNQKWLNDLLPEIDLLFINRLSDDMDVETLTQQCNQLINMKTILVLNNIRGNLVMKKFWQSLHNHPQSSVMTDLYTIGIAFFNNRLPKQCYKVYFNDGKKQNLHPNWRQGLHFISRRKKSSQDSSAH